VRFAEEEDVTPSTVISKDDDDDDDDDDSSTTKPTQRQKKKKKNPNNNIKNTPEEDHRLLGLMCVTTTDKRVISLSKGNVLGRNSSKLQLMPQNNTNNHVDLGIPNEKNTRNIPRELFQVQTVSRSCLTLILSQRLSKESMNNVQKYGIAKYMRHNKKAYTSIQNNNKASNTSTKSSSSSSSSSVELWLGDELILGHSKRNFRFRVVKVDSSDNGPPPLMTDRKRNRKRGPLTDLWNATTTTTPDARPKKKKPNHSPAASMTNLSDETMEMTTPTIAAKETSKNANNASKHKKKEATLADHIDANRCIALPEGLQPFRPSRRWGDFEGPSAPETSTITPKAADTLPKKTTEAKAAYQPPDTEHDSDHDEDDDAAAKGDGPTDMHTSLANAYWKALNSAQPHIGSQSLHMLLDSDELPPLKLCGDLIHLLTFGPLNQGHAFYDGNRIQMALAYVQRLVEKHPKLMYERLAEAAGNEYWKTVLDQLLTLPYGEDDTIADALNLHCFSMKVLELLWGGLQTMENCTQLPLIRDLHAYGGKAACVVAANALAHVWVRHGKYLLVGQRGGNSSLLDVTYQLTQQLARIVTSWLQEFVANNRDCLDILGNAMDAQLCDSSIPKKEQQDLKLYWVCSMDRTSSSWYLGPQLAKFVGIQREYSRLTGKIK
jgi:hypothetical protein